MKEQKDHKELGRILDLFHLEGKNPGVVFWHPKGTILYHLVVDHLRAKLKEQGYLEIKTPNILTSETFKKSGHYDNYRDKLFFAGNFVQIEQESPKWIITPMNCPGTLAVFNSTMRSYRDLPLKYSEMGQVYRYEQPGEVNGLLRVREFTVDDAHIFCLQKQAAEEIDKLVKFIPEFYKEYDFTNYHIDLSTRPKKSIGTDEQWQMMEGALKDILKKEKITYKENPGEGVFYGPKIDFHIEDFHGRSWQMGTIQFDLNIPERLDCFYIDEDGKKKHPVMVHRAIFGSIERFIAVLLEHTGGALPVWLAPTQAIILPVSEKHLDYAKKVAEEIKKSDIRIEIDLRNESVGKKIRDAEIQKIPYIIVVGDKEEKGKNITVRKRGSKDLKILTIDEISKEIND